MSGPLTTDDLSQAMLLVSGKIPDKRQQRVMREQAGFAANVEFLTKELYPRMYEDVLGHMRRAKTSEELWVALGYLKATDGMVELTESRIKSFNSV